MSTNAVCLQKNDQETLVQALRDAPDKLAAGGEVVLDFSSVQRIDAPVIAELEKLASAAESKNAKVVLSGVCINVYKVLKLLKLAPRFTINT